VLFRSLAAPQLFDPYRCGKVSKDAEYFPLHLFALLSTPKVNRYIPA
jgi:hypothetical protein